MTKPNGAATVPPATDLEAEIARIVRHQATGRLGEATAALDKAVAAHGDLPRLMHLKALNLAMGGDAAEAETLMQGNLRHNPDDGLQQLDLGVLLAQQGRIDEALTHFREAVELMPNNGLAHSNLGGALVLQKKYGEAVRHLERAVHLEPQQLDAHTNLGTAYLQTNRADRAVPVLYKALAIDPLSVRAHIGLSAALYRSDRHDTAEYHARRAIELAPNAAEAHLHLGNALASAGRLDEAAEVLLPLAGHPPVGLPALSRLIHMRKTRRDAPEFAILENYLERAEQLADEGRATLEFSAGKAFDDLGEPDRAMAHFHIANAATKRLFPFDTERYLKRSERLFAMAAPDFVDRCGTAGIRDIAPIFITGMPRSGTTLMDQMFSRHPKVTAGGELRALPSAIFQADTPIRQAIQGTVQIDDLNADDLTALGERYMDAVRGEGIKSERVSDKMPANYLYAALIACALPRAKILIMRRHPLDCLLSNYFQHFGQNQPFSTSFETMALAYEEFDKFAKRGAELLPDRVRVVHYEDVTADAEGQMRAILEWVGLEWDAEVLNYQGSSRAVNTASLAQVREPIYTRSVARWRPYARHLAPLAERLAPYLSAEDLAACRAES